MEQTQNTGVIRGQHGQSNATPVDTTWFINISCNFTGIVAALENVPPNDNVYGIADVKMQRSVAQIAQSPQIPQIALISLISLIFVKFLQVLHFQ